MTTQRIAPFTTDSEVRRQISGAELKAELHMLIDSIPDLVPVVRDCRQRGILNETVITISEGLRPLNLIIFDRRAEL